MWNIQRIMWEFFVFTSTKLTNFNSWYSCFKRFSSVHNVLLTPLRNIEKISKTKL